ncbi:MAG: hypothetical protein IH784_02115 [Bacteroidetes bacterium]|nr:hypothetical protein [Bacteroidota bacterium]
MKHNSTFLIMAILLIVLVCPGFILISSSDYNPSLLSNSSNTSLEYEQINTLQNELRAKYFAADTFDIDIDMDEFDEEMKELQKELGKIKSYKFDFDFDNEEFRTQMEELKKELSELDLEEFHFDFDNEEFRTQMEELKKELSGLDLEEFHFEFDDEEFRMNMEELKNELKEQKYSFGFDMDNFKEEMEGLREELNDLKIDLKDLDIELNKLDGFMDDLREELESDGLIDNKDDDFDLDLSNDKMIINGEPVPDELFKKYKDMYEEHFGKKLDGDHKLKIRQG